MKMMVKLFQWVQKCVCFCYNKFGIICRTCFPYQRFWIVFLGSHAEWWRIHSYQGWATYGPRAILVRPARPTEDKNPVGGYSHPLADIICLSIAHPCLMQILYPMTPCLLPSTPKEPPFLKNWNVKFQIFHTHFIFFSILQLTMANIHLNLTQFTPNDPLFWEVYTKAFNSLSSMHTQ